MARQILQAGPSNRSLRQQAFDDAINQATQGASGVYQSIKQNEETDRNKALQALEMSSKLGTMVSPEDVSDPLRFKNLQRAVVDRAQEEKKQSLYDKNLERQYKQAQINETKNKGVGGGLQAKALESTIIDNAKTNAKLLGVKSGIDSAISQLENKTLSYDEKVKVGQNLLKLLNSAEGSDAVGVEESRRLGSFLESNFTPWAPGGLRLQADNDLFLKQIKNQSEILGDRILNNEKNASDLLSGKSVTEVVASGKTNRNMAQQLPPGFFPIGNTANYNAQSIQSQIVPQAQAAGGVQDRQDISSPERTQLRQQRIMELRNKAGAR